jgi:hypothetical protein
MEYKNQNSKKQKLDDNFLGNNAASNIKKARFVQVFLNSAIWSGSGSGFGSGTWSGTGTGTNTHLLVE